MNNKICLLKPLSIKKEIKKKFKNSKNLKFHE